MSKTLYVARSDIVDAAYSQFKESEGESYPLVIDGDDLVYKGAGGNYYDDDKTSAYDVVTNIEFKKQGSNAENALQHYGDLKDTVEIGGTTYNLEYR